MRRIPVKFVRLGMDEVEEFDRVEVFFDFLFNKPHASEG